MSSRNDALPLETEVSSISTTPSTSAGRADKTPKRSGKRQPTGETSSIEDALVNFINESRNNSGNTETDSDDLLFMNYAKRTKTLPKEVQTFIKLQMSQLFFNVENRSGIQIPITPLPQELVPSLLQNSQYANQQPLPISNHYGDTMIPGQTESSGATSDLLSAAMHMTFQ